MNPTSFIPHLYQDLPPIGNKLIGKGGNNATGTAHSNIDLDISTSMIPSFGSKLGLLLPDPAPDVAPNPDQTMTATTTPSFNVAQPSKFPYKTHNKWPHYDQHFNETLFCIADKMADNNLEISNPNEPRKKKYAKEAWPGRKPLLSGL